jgi:hypothetical protein
VRKIGLGAVQLVDGLVALPLLPDTREQLECVADEVVEAGGEATVWLEDSATKAQDRAIAARISDAGAADYRAVIEAAARAAESDTTARRRALRRLRRALHRVDARAHFPRPEATEARAGVEQLAGLVEAAP